MAKLVRPSVIERRLLVGVTLLALCFPTVARPPGNFGFGPPPSYFDVLEKLAPIVLSIAPYEVEAMGSEALMASIVIGVAPQAGCLDRGFGKRSVCGYRICAAMRGFPIREMWITQGFGVWDMRSQGRCLNLPSGDAGWRGDPPVNVVRFCNIQPEFPGCPGGDEGFSPLSLEESTGAARLARERAEREGRDQDRQVDREMIVREALEFGPTLGYLKMASALYSECRRYADDVFIVDAKVTEEEIASLDACGTDSQALLSNHIRPALDAAPAVAQDAVKDLHAYTIASLRALDNYRQSIIEARQDRSARMAGIDERVARIELELP